MFQYLGLYFTGFFITCNGSKWYFNDDVLTIFTGHIVLTTGSTVIGQYIFIVT